MEKIIYVNFDYGLCESQSHLVNFRRTDGSVNWQALYLAEQKGQPLPRAASNMFEKLRALEDAGFEISFISERPERFRLGISALLREMGLTIKSPAVRGRDYLSSVRPLILQEEKSHYVRDPAWIAAALRVQVKTDTEISYVDSRGEVLAGVPAGVIIYYSVDEVIAEVKPVRQFTAGLTFHDAINYI